MLKSLEAISQAGEQVDARAILVDISHSTQFRQEGQPKVKESKEEYIVCRHILKSFQDTKQPLEIEAFLDEMCSEDKRAPDSILLVTIGNDRIPPWIRWTRDPKTVAVDWYKKARAPRPHEIGNGTNYVPSIEALLAQKAFAPASTPSRLIIRCDGLSHDYPTKLAFSFEKLLKTYPMLIVDVEAFVLAAPPNFDNISSAVAGIDVYKLIPNHFLSSFKAMYLLTPEGEEAENPLIHELAVSSQTGARFSVAGVTFQIPSTDIARKTMLKDILTTLCSADETELKSISTQEMRNLLQNLHNLAEPLLHPGVVRRWLSDLLNTWLSSHGYSASLETIEEHLNKLLFIEKTEAILSTESHRIRGQQERKATFAEILKYWERGNPIFGKCTYGASAVCIPCDDLTSCIILTLGSETQEILNDNTGLLVHDSKVFMVFPSLNAAGLVNDDYARMAIRRVVSEALETVGCGPAAYWSRRIEVVAIVAILAAQYRSACPTSLATTFLTSILQKLLSKEQFTIRGDTSCSALTLLQNGQPLPTEHSKCSLLGSNPRQFLLFALGWSGGVPPDTLWQKIRVENHIETCASGEWAPPKKVCYKDLISKMPSNPSALSLASLLASTVGSTDAKHTEQKVVVVPGCLSSGKTTAFQILLDQFPKDKFVLMTSLDAYLDKAPPDEDPRVLIFDHHPDLITQPGIRFRPELGRICTNKDRDFIHKYKPQIIFVNTNSRDGAYLGLKQKPMEFPGTLRNRETMTVEDWKNFLCFCVGNAERRLDGFKPIGAQRAKWFEIAKKKLDLPQHLASKLVDLNVNTSKREIDERRDRHLMKQNRTEEVSERGRAFALEVWSS